MHMTMNVHGVIEIRARYHEINDSMWTTLELHDDEGKTFDLTVFSYDTDFLRALADKLNQLPAATAPF